LKQQGWKQTDIARALGVSEGAVSQWFSRVEREGEAGLARHPPPGPTPKLSEAQRQQIPQLLAQGAEAHGFRGNVWTSGRIRDVIARQFGVRYHRDHVRKLLRAMGLSYQQPVERATQRDEARIAAWMHERWPQIKKAEQEGYTVVFVDEAGFSLLPMAVRGQTPVLRVPLTRDHLSAISGVTPDGRLFLQVRQATDDADAVVAFLRVLLRKIPGKVLLIWVGSPIHRAQPIKDFLKRGAARRLGLEQVPGYAPDLNPDEGIWNYLKRVELGNGCCPDLHTLALELMRARERLRHKRAIIRSCFSASGLSL
jgi:transposase